MAATFAAMRCCAISFLLSFLAASHGQCIAVQHQSRLDGGHVRSNALLCDFFLAQLLAVRCDFSGGDFGGGDLCRHEKGTPRRFEKAFRSKG
jgi:hypothetical protein